MKNQPELTSLTIEELNKKLKTTKFATGMLTGILIVQLIVGVYLSVKNGFSIFIIVPIAFLPILIINYQNIKKINEEIARREK